MPVNAQPQGFGPSIHFGIEEQVYRKDPALSYSGMKALLESPLEYWMMSPLNPNRVEYETDALKAGKEFHCLLLEPEKFKERYYVAPVEPSHGRRMVKLSDFNEMKGAIDVLKEMETYPLFFEGGYPEVAIFWRDPITGLMLKTKHDYFKPVYSTDYKTSDKLNFRKLRWKITEYGYDIQSSLYLESRMQIRAALQSDEALIYGDVDPKFLRDFMHSENDSFVFVFQKKKAPHGVSLGPLDQRYNDDGARAVRQATETYNRYIKKYGTKMWPVSDGRITEFSRYNNDNAI